MSDKDIITKDYLSDSRIFADAFNCYMYGGRQVIAPERLRSIDTTEIGVPYGGDSSGAPVQKYRDMLKCLAAMEDDTRIYLLLGIEAQSNDSYSMPVRNMVYDALQYAGQVDEAAREHRRDRAGKKPTPAEYLSGFYREDRLVPVITLVIYFSPDRWNGPRSLYEMLSTDDPEILRFVSDYRINLLCPAELSDDELGSMKTSLHEVFQFVKNSRDGERLAETVRSNSAFRHLDTKAARVISAVTGTELEIDETKEVVDVCQAITEIRSKATMEGILIGKTQGRAEGKTEGRQQKTREVLIAMIRSGLLDTDMIAKLADVSVNEVEAVRAELDN